MPRPAGLAVSVACLLAIAFASLAAVAVLTAQASEQQLEITSARADAETARAEAAEQVRAALADLEKAAAIEKTRQLTNAWVAKYRRDKGITGRPSYGNVYSALNAVSGHYNNFGTKYPLPAKRKDRVMQEFGTAEIALSRGR